MKSWEILERCIPPGTAGKVARTLSRSAELINRYRRRPPQEEDEDGNLYSRPHRLNPMEVLELIQDHAFAHAPHDSHLIHTYFSTRYEQHFSLRLSADGGLTEILREYLAKLPPDYARQKWEELQNAAEEILSEQELESKRQKIEVLQAQVEKVRRIP